MNTLANHFFLLSLLLCLNACHKEPEPEPEPEIIVPETPYGTPFGSMPDIDDIVMYEVNLRAFSETGDIPGIINRLSDIKSLGVNVIWLMPIYPIGQINSVNSPYSVKDYYSIASEYGTLGDLRELSDSAHKMDMAVILDWVANHTSWDNNWITNKDWYSQDAEGNIIHPAGTNWQDVADLNYNNTNMQDAMIAAMKYWAWEANIDGFRCDYADGVPFTFWKRAIDTINTIHSRDFIFLAEGSRTDHYTAGFDLIYAWDFYYKLVSVFEGENAKNLMNVNASESNKSPENKQILRYSTNHDESAWNKTPMILYGGKEGALAASVATIFIGGCPLFYTGQEVGTVENIPFFSNSTINWEANPDMFKEYQDIMKFYEESDAARNGSLEDYSNADILCFRKKSSTDEILVIINIRAESIDFQVPAGIESSSWINVLSGEQIVLESSQSLAGYHYILLKK